jgi:hypothetical protein
VFFLTAGSNARVPLPAGNAVLAITAPPKRPFQCDSSSHCGAVYMVADEMVYKISPPRAISDAIHCIQDAADIQSEMK